MSTERPFILQVFYSQDGVEEVKIESFPDYVASILFEVAAEECLEKEGAEAYVDDIMSKLDHFMLGGNVVAVAERAYSKALWAGGEFDSGENMHDGIKAGIKELASPGSGETEPYGPAQNWRSKRDGENDHR